MGQRRSSWTARQASRSLRPTVIRSPAEVAVADQLLRDRRGALHGPPGLEVRERGAGDALVVERAVLPEAPVLDRHRRLRQPVRHRAERHRLAMARGGDGAEERAVAGVHERGPGGDLGRERRLGARADRVRVGPERHRGAGGRRAGHDDAEERDREDPVPAPPPAAPSRTSHRRGGRARHRGSAALRIRARPTFGGRFRVGVVRRAQSGSDATPRGAIRRRSRRALPTAVRRRRSGGASRRR